MIDICLVYLANGLNKCHSAVEVLEALLQFEEVESNRPLDHGLDSRELPRAIALNNAQPLEVRTTDALVGLTEIHTSLHLGCAFFFQDKEQGCPKAVGGLQ